MTDLQKQVDELEGVVRNMANLLASMSEAHGALLEQARVTQAIASGQLAALHGVAGIALALADSTSRIDVISHLQVAMEAYAGMENRPEPEFFEAFIGLAQAWFPDEDWAV